MLGKTHLAVGVATALIITQPHSLDEIVATVIGGAVGGIICDIDVKIDRSNRFAEKASTDALYGEIAAGILASSLLLANWFMEGTVCRVVADNGMLAILGAVLFLILFVIGEKSKHRDRTHSLFFMIAFTISVMLIHLNIGLAFLFGYASHLTIDLLNKSPERLFYPRKKGVCFEICYADRFGNELLFVIGIAVIVLYFYGVASYFI